MINSNIICNVTYPDPLADYKSQDEDFSVVFPINEDSKPIIILFGWAGSKDKYLSIYSKIYEAKGFITLRCIIPLKTMFLGKSRMPIISQNLVKLVHDLHFGDRLFIIHCFSTGGAFGYQHFAHALKLSSKPLQVKGVIFDSAPSKRRISSVFRAIRPIVGGNIVFNYIITLLILLIFITAWILEFILINVIKVKIVEFKPFINLLDDDTHWPQHFIFSKADTVTIYQDVEYFADHRKSLGVDISKKMYENTSHVKHYPENKLSYTKSIFTFMNKCLDSSMV